MQPDRQPSYSGREAAAVVADLLYGFDYPKRRDNAGQAFTSRSGKRVTIQISARFGASSHQNKSLLFPRIAG
jgi:hypothetical protein